MKKKNIFPGLIIAVLIAMCIFDGIGISSNNKVAISPEPLSIVVASDLHYISPALTDKGPYFKKVIESSDAKDMMYIEEIVDAFVEDVIDLHPDVLILSGDLSFNGAYQSHADLAKKLKDVKDAGVQVYVIPGNHDINYPYAAKFEGDYYSFVFSTSAEEFRNLYGSLGYGQAISVDKKSGSYVVAPRNDLWIVMLDTNSYGSNYLLDESIDWLEEQLKAAKEKGVQVMSVSHQNILQHSAKFNTDYQIYTYKDILELYNKYDVKINFSGHMHIQHWLKNGNFTEVLTSALSAGENHYGLVTYKEGSIAYEVVNLDVSTWAKNHGKTDSNLLDFPTYSRNYFDYTAKDNSAARAIEKGASEEEAVMMLTASNQARFSQFNGRSLKKDKDMEKAIALFRKYGNAKKAAQLEAYLLDLSRDSGYCQFEIK